MKASATNIKVRDYSLADPLTALRYLQNLEQVVEFHDRHWRFAKDYILKQNKSLVGTGGAPIRQMLSNSFLTALDMVDSTAQSIDTGKLSQEDKDVHAGVCTRCQAMRKIIYSDLNIQDDTASSLIYLPPTKPLEVIRK